MCTKDQENDDSFLMVSMCANIWNTSDLWTEWKRQYLIQ